MRKKIVMEVIKAITCCGSIKTTFEELLSTKESVQESRIGISPIVSTEVETHNEGLQVTQ